MKYIETPQAQIKKDNESLCMLAIGVQELCNYHFKIYYVGRNEDGSSQLNKTKLVSLQLIYQCSSQELKMEGHDFEKRALQHVKNYEKGQYSYFLLLNIKNVFQHYNFSSLHQIQCIYMTHCLYIFYYICTEMQLKSEDQ